MKNGISALAVAKAVANLAAATSPVGWVEHPVWYVAWPIPRRKSSGAGRRPIVSPKIRKGRRG